MSSASGAFAATVRLAWDPNSESDLAGYRLFRGTQSGNYNWIQDVGLVTLYDVNSLTAGTTYYFALTAFNDAGLESPRSVEINYRVPTSNQAPLADNANVSTSEDSSVLITLSGSDPDGGSLTYSITQSPANGTLSGTLPNVTYVPKANFNGSDSFRFTVSDGLLTSAAATVSVSVAPVNDAPAAVAASLSFGGVLQLPITLVGSDPDGDSLTYSISQGPSKGTLTGVPPLVVYIPPPLGLNGSDSFQFTVSDGKVTSAPATISLLGSAPVNHAPVASSSSVSVPEDGSVSLILSGSDADGDPLSFSVVQSPAKGTLTGTPPNLTYRPQANFRGQDSLQFTVNDGKVTSSAATVSITVTAVNDPPVAAAASLTVAEDSQISITLSGSDPDGDPLTYSISSAASNGTLSGTPPNLSYSPKANFHGQDTFQFTVSDGKVTSAPAIVTLTVTSVNDVPVATSASVNVDENSSVAITLTGTDPDGDSLTFGVTVSPLHGSLSGPLPNLTYTPISGYSGTDSFKFTANDGTVSSSAATISITVKFVNSPPSATSRTATLAEDTPVSFHIRGTDADGDTLTFSITQQPANGTLSGFTGYPPLVTYTPNSNFYGSDSFRFTVNDGIATSAPATVSITVTAVNDPPTATSKSVSVSEDGSVGITLGGSDVDGDSLSFVITQSPANGVLSGTAPNLTYTPSPDFNGADAFNFMVSDGKVSSAAAAVSITVIPVNDPPVASAKSVSVSEDGSVALTLSGSDPDGDNVTFAVTAPPSHGSLSGTPPNLSYNPAGGFSGADSFKFTVNDGKVTSSAATVSITVLPVNDPPVAVSSSAIVAENSSVAITLTGTDLDGDSLTFGVTVSPLHGSLSGPLPNLTYTPNSGYSGTDAFKFTANDGTVSSSAATVSITVSAVNEPPVALARSVSVAENSSVAITLTGTDPDGDSLTFSVTASPLHGSLSGPLPNLTYTPNPDFSGTDSFKFTANDGTVSSSAATVSITVNAVNQPPVALAKSVSVAENSSVAITLTGTDPDGDSLTFSVTVSPLHGSLSGPLPNLTYTPNPDFSGTDSFKFTANDGTVSSPAATVSITVNAVNDGPIASAKSVTVAEDDSVDITLTGSDSGGNSLTFTVTASPTHGDLSGNPPNLIYTPDPNYNGTDSFKFTANDGTVTSAAATVSITVTPVNDPPSALAISTSTAMNSPVAVTLSGSDLDGDSLSFAVAQAPSHGTLSGTPPALTYSPNAGFSGSDSFAYIVSDGKASSASATVNIVVSTVNLPPVAESQTMTMVEDTSLPITLEASDPNGDMFAFTITQPPSNGSLIGDPPELTYRPNANYFGSDSFQFTVNDTLATSAPATVSINILAVNDSPIALPVTLNLREDLPMILVLKGYDPDGDSLSFSVVSLPTSGILVGFPPYVIYRPALNFNGEDSFQFTVNDGRLASQPASVVITVSPVNDPPVGGPRIINASMTAPTPVTLTGTDPDGDPLTYSIIQLPSHGRVVGTAPNLDYVPDADFAGSDSFQYSVSDGQVTSDPVTVVLDSNPTRGSTDWGDPPPPSTDPTSDELPIPQPPTANADALDVEQGGTATILSSGARSVLANDVVDGDRQLVAVVRQPPTHGTIDLQPDGTFVYRHLGDRDVSDSFTYSAIAGASATGETTVEIRVLQWFSVQAAGSNTELEFNVAPGLLYDVDLGSPTRGGSTDWQVFSSFIARTEGLADLTESTPYSNDAARLFRVRCEGAHGEFASEIWSRQNLVLLPGDNSFVIPFQGSLIRRARALTVGSHWVQLEGDDWSAVQLDRRDGFASHILVITAAGNPESVGHWWPLTTHDGATLVVAANSPDLASKLQPGDVVEVRRLPVLADLLGSGVLLEGDQLSVTSDSNGNAWTFVYHDGSTAPAGFYFGSAGSAPRSYDGTTISLRPEQVISCHRSATATTSGALTGPFPSISLAP